MDLEDLKVLMAASILGSAVCLSRVMTSEGGDPFRWEGPSDAKIKAALRTANRIWELRNEV